MEHELRGLPYFISLNVDRDLDHLRKSMEPHLSVEG